MTIQIQERERVFSYVGPISDETRQELIALGRSYKATDQMLNDWLTDRTGEGLPK